MHRRDAFLQGARLFDRGAFFEAHEAWEKRWLVETDASWKTFLQGLIQVAAGFHKLVVVRDRASAARLFDKGLAKLVTRPEGIEAEALARFCEEVCAEAARIATGTPPVPARSRAWPVSLRMAGAPEGADSTARLRAAPRRSG
jgi:hypothetical protein